MEEVKLDPLDEAIELVKIGSASGGYRTYPGSGGMWIGGNRDMADARFDDWGLARATAEILNAIVEERLRRTDRDERSDGEIK